MRNWVNEITQQELIDHIEEDDFFTVYGNPVIVHGDDGRDVVCMSYKLHLLLERKKAEMEEQIKRMAAEAEQYKARKEKACGQQE